MSEQSHAIHVLGIESSCDDTGVAIVRDDGKILSNCVHSQLKQHLNHGGIIPMVAKEYHLDNIDNVAKRALTESGLTSIEKDIDAIAVATRPGLNYSLQVGMNYAKQLARKYSKPLIPIHHMQAHALMPLLENRSIRFPFLALLMSGGHCIISICKRFNQFDLLGTTKDDAPGDLLDKVARRCRLRNLGPPYDSISGGAALELLARRPGADKFKYFNTELNIPMLNVKGCDLSFSGYHGSVRFLLPQIDELWRSGDREALLDELSHLSGSLQRAILIQLAKKLQRALVYYRMHWRYENLNTFKSDEEVWQSMGFDVRPENDSDIMDVVISGGVAANNYLVKGIENACEVEIDESIKTYAPTKSLCSDNGLMIAWNGILRYKDYLRNRSKYCDLEPDEDVITNSDNFDQIRQKTVSPIGNDIRSQLELKTINISRFKSAELKLRTRQQVSS